MSTDAFEREPDIRRVFVGNIPYDATEQQVIDVLSTVGKVVSFRVQFDRQTGKPLGFGFGEFADAATAASGVRNLHNKEFHGRRLRVQLAEPERRDVAPEERTRNQIAEHLEAVGKVVNGMSLAHRHEALVAIKAFIAQQPAQAHQLLSQFPQLAHALLGAQASLGAVRASDFAALQQQVPNPTSAGAGASTGAPPPPTAALPPSSHLPPQAMPSAPPLPPHHAYAPHAWPPHAGGAPPPPPLPPMSHLPAAAAAVLSPEQQVLMRELMSLTPDRFALLPAHVQDQVRQFHLLMAAGR